jgi:lipoprotein-releasing system permease protein
MIRSNKGPVGLMAARYLWSGTMGSRRLHYSQWISLISLVGLALGTAALVVVLSVYNGLEEMTLTLYNKFNPELKVQPAEGMYLDAGYWIPRICKVQGVKAVSATLQSNALLRYQGKEALIWTKGVDAEYDKVLNLPASLLWPETEPADFMGLIRGRPWALMGVGLADQLAMELGPTAAPVQVFLPRHGVALNPLFPEQGFVSRPLVVEGVFDLQPEVNRQMVVMDLDSMRGMMGLEASKAGALELALHSEATAEQVRRELQDLSAKAGPSGNLVIKDRLEQESVMLKIFASEKWWTFAFLMFIVILAAMNLIGSLSMLVLQKRSDIEVLGVLGARPNLIKAIFWRAGMGIVTSGALIGLVLGSGLCMAQEKWSLVTFPASANIQILAYPVDLHGLDLFGIWLGVMAVGAIFAWFPAKRSASYLSGWSGRE